MEKGIPENRTRTDAVATAHRWTAGTRGQDSNRDIAHDKGSPSGRCYNPQRTCTRAPNRNLPLQEEKLEGTGRTDKSSHGSEISIFFHHYSVEQTENQLSAELGSLKIHGDRSPAPPSEASWWLRTFPPWV